MDPSFELSLFVSSNEKEMLNLNQKEERKLNKSMQTNKHTSH